MDHLTEIGNAKREQPRLLIGQNGPIVIAIVGITSESGDLREELRKAKIAEQVGADMIADVSTVFNSTEIHSELLTELTIPVSTVPLYEIWRIASKRGEWPKQLSSNLILDVIEKQAELGVDCMTLHSAFTLSQLNAIDQSGRGIQMQARGGGLIRQFMASTGKENPLFECFDDILMILRKNHVSVSIGCSCRTGTVDDPIDDIIWQEALVQAQLVRDCRENNVPVMVEGLSHIRYGLIKPYVRSMKSLTDGAPLRLLGPISTEKGLGYDHITAAISATEAVIAGVDALTCVTRAEHIGIPDEEELREAVVATKIAIEVAKQNWNRETEKSSFRCGMGFSKLNKDDVIDYNKALELKKLKSGDVIDSCQMCNETCPLILMEEDDI